MDGAQLHAAEKHHSPKGMLLSLWSDVSEIVAARNMDNNGTYVPAADFLRCFADLEMEPSPASVRWPLMLMEYRQLALQRQGLPGAAA